MNFSLLNYPTTTYSMPTYTFTLNFRCYISKNERRNNKNNKKPMKSVVCNVLLKKFLSDTVIS